MSIAVLSDAHLLMQAEWIENESQIAKEGEEVLGNFHKAIGQAIFWSSLQDGQVMKWEA